jgi:NAD(P)-dependent dehydrogenase (short-subunit alcohol dehydrogenase family)
MKKALVIGVGPLNGLGAQLCKKIANNNFEVFVAGRTKGNLDLVVNSIIQDGNKAKSLVIDTTNEAHVKEMTKFVGSGLDFAVYNVGNNRPGKIIDMDASYFKESWETGCFGGFLFAKEGYKNLLEREKQLELLFSLAQVPL